MTSTKKKCITTICLIAGLVFSNAPAVFSQDSLSAADSRQLIIDTIFIEGNKKTKDKIILLYMGIDAGDVFDTAAITVAKQNLKTSGLFKEVKILTVTTKDKATLWVTLTENQYFRLSDIGGVIYDRKYGENTEWPWFHVYSALSFGNFRGRNENLDISGGFWTVRNLGFSWFKPFITQPYYIRIGTTIGSAPSITQAWHCNFYNTTYATLGRQLGKHSKLFSTVQGRYLKYTWKGGDGILEINGNEVKKLPYDSLFPPFERDTTWTYLKTKVDSTGKIDSTTYSWQGYSNEKILKYEDPFTEALISLGWVIDMRNETFDPHKGFYFSTVATTNALWPYNDISLKNYERRYLQVNFAFHFFHRGIWESNTVAYKINPLFRLFGKGNIHSGLYMGSESSLRGYGHGAFGGWEYNQRVLFSWEYRFQLFKLPEMQFPWLAWYDKSLNNLQTRIDGALILDCGYIWKDLLNLQHPNKDNEHAAGTGFGIRIMFPGMKRSVCAEAIWPIFYPDWYGKKLENKGTEGVPVIYLYLDLPF